MLRGSESGFKTAQFTFLPFYLFTWGCSEVQNQASRRLILPFFLFTFLPRKRLGKKVKRGFWTTGGHFENTQFKLSPIMLADMTRCRGGVTETRFSENSLHYTIFRENTMWKIRHLFLLFHDILDELAVSENIFSFKLNQMTNFAMNQSRFIKSLGRLIHFLCFLR